MGLLECPQLGEGSRARAVASPCLLTRYGGCGRTVLSARAGLARGYCSHRDLPALVQGAASPLQVDRIYLSSHGQVPLTRWGSLLTQLVTASPSEAQGGGGWGSVQEGSGGTGTDSSDLPSCSHSHRNRFPQLLAGLEQLNQPSAYHFMRYYQAEHFQTCNSSSSPLLFQGRHFHLLTKTSFRMLMETEVEHPMWL